MNFSKKSVSKLLTLLLTALLVLSTFCVSVSADDLREHNYTLTETDPTTLYETVGGDVEDTDYTHDEYIQALSDAGTDNAFLAILSSSKSGLKVPGTSQSTWISVLNVINNGKTVSITKDMSPAEGLGLDNKNRPYWGYWYVGATGENLACYSKPEIPFTYKFSKAKNGARNEYVTSLGMEITISANGVAGESVEVVATYANLKDDDVQTKTLTHEFVADGETVQPASHFYGFKAPDDYYIQKIVVMNKEGIHWFRISDMCFITSEIDGPDPIISDLVVSGKQEIISPVYHTTDEYEYTAKVLDQFGEEMMDEEVIISLKSPTDNENVTFDGKTLTIKQDSSVPDTITLTAYAKNNPEVTEDYVITLSGTPYYNEALIGVPDGNPEYVMSEFKADIAAATATDGKDWTIFNFESEDFTYSGSEAQMPLENSKETFTLKRVGTNINKSVSENGMAGGRRVTPSSGDCYSLLVPSSSGDNTYTFNTDNLGNMRVTKLGVVILSYNAMKAYEEETGEGFYIEATFSNGTKQKYSKAIPDGGTAVGNVFFAVKAPEGHYITMLDIETQLKVWSDFDDLCVILEEPDTLTLDEAYANFMFSTVTTQDLKNIREDLPLPTVTPEGATIVWESDKPEVINPVTGKVTLPDLAENSNVKLKANITYGVLTSTRSFDLYVPSKLELDSDALTLPESVDDDIDLPLVGSEQGSTITWATDDDDLITASGKVKRPEGRDGYVILTATLSNDSGSVTKEFPITVSGSVRDESFGGGKGSGGGGGGSRGGSVVAITTPVAVPETLPEVSSPVSSVFKDLQVAHWAHDNIIKLYEKKIVNGTGDGSFEPEGKVTREQFISMLVRALDIKGENAKISFTDADENGWYAESLALAVSNGIISGRDDGSFGIGQEITREEMAVMTYRALKAVGRDIETENKTEWKDAEEISGFAVDAVSALKEKGIISGVSEDEFSPKTTTTRAQAATIVCRVLEGV